ncbi:hypothetical protein Tco_1217008 [Tanacetum coccineum]
MMERSSGEAGRTKVVPGPEALALELGLAKTSRHAQMNPSPAFVKENLGVQRLLGRVRHFKGTGAILPMRLEGISKSRSNSVGISNKSQSERSVRRKSSPESGYDNMSSASLEDLNAPYKRPKLDPFTSRITRFKYHRRAKLPQKIRVYDEEQRSERSFWHVLHRSRAKRVAYADLVRDVPPNRGREGDITFRDRVFPENIGEYLKNIDILFLIEDEYRFSSLSDPDCIRVCLLLSLEVIFMGHELGSAVDDVFLRMVEDLDVWNDFHWGEHMWREIYDAGVQQLCLLCECLQKSIPAIQDNCASLQSITALESSLSLKKLRIAKGKRVMYGEDELMEGNVVFGEIGATIPTPLYLLRERLGLPERHGHSLWMPAIWHVLVSALQTERHRTKDSDSLTQHIQHEQDRFREFQHTRDVAPDDADGSS